MGCSHWFWLYNYERHCHEPSHACLLGTCTRVSRRDRPMSRTAGPQGIHAYNEKLPKRLHQFTRPPAASVSSCCLLSMAGNIQQFTSCQRLAVKWDLTMVFIGISWRLIRLTGTLWMFMCGLCLLIYEMPVPSFWRVVFFFFQSYRNSFHIVDTSSLYPLSLYSAFDELNVLILM